MTIVEAAREGTAWRIRFAEVPDRTSAEALRGRFLEAEAGEPLPSGHVYWHDLLGVGVRDEEGRELGRVGAVYRAGGAEVLSVVGPLGELEIPVVAGIVRVFDPAGQGVVVDRIALGLEEAEERGPVGEPSRPRRPRRRAPGAGAVRSGAPPGGPPGEPAPSRSRPPRAG